MPAKLTTTINKIQTVPNSDPFNEIVIEPILPLMKGLDNQHLAGPIEFRF